MVEFLAKICFDTAGNKRRKVPQKGSHDCHSWQYTLLRSSDGNRTGRLHSPQRSEASIRGPKCATLRDHPSIKCVDDATAASISPGCTGAPRGGIRGTLAVLSLWVFTTRVGRKGVLFQTTNPFFLPTYPLFNQTLYKISPRVPKIFPPTK